jgi:hypothetical protein
MIRWRIEVVRGARKLFVVDGGTAGKICSSGALPTLDECLYNRVASRSDPAVWVA